MWVTFTPNGLNPFLPCGYRVSPKFERIICRKPVNIFGHTAAVPAIRVCESFSSSEKASGQACVSMTALSRSTYLVHQWRSRRYSYPVPQRCSPCDWQDFQNHRRLIAHRILRASRRLSEILRHCRASFCPGKILLGPFWKFQMRSPAQERRAIRFKKVARDVEVKYRQRWQNWFVLYTAMVHFILKL